MDRKLSCVWISSNVLLRLSLFPICEVLTSLPQWFCWTCGSTYTCCWLLNSPMGVPCSTVDLYPFTLYHFLFRLPVCFSIYTCSVQLALLEQLPSFLRFPAFPRITYLLPYLTSRVPTLALSIIFASLLCTLADFPDHLLFPAIVLCTRDWSSDLQMGVPGDRDVAPECRKSIPTIKGPSEEAGCGLNSALGNPNLVSYKGSLP